MKAFSATGAAQQNLHELSSGNYFTGMAYPQSGVSVISPTGEFLHSQIYQIDTFLALQSVERYSDNEFFFAGNYWKDTCTANGSRIVYPTIGTMDSLGNILSANYYAMSDVNCSNWCGNVMVTQGKEAIAWGKDESLFALKADSAGSLIWAKHSNRHGSFRFIKELPGGDLLAGFNLDTAGASVARLHANGDFVWCKSYVRPSGMMHDCVVESDDAFYITGFTDTIAGVSGLFIPPPPDYHPELFMMKLNGAGEVLWCKAYTTPDHWVTTSASSIERTLDGNLVVLSNLRVGSTARPCLMKADLNGDTLWTRSHGRSNYLYETNKLLASSDGGFIFNGQIWGDLPIELLGPNCSFLFKSDSMGHLPCFERHYPIQVEDIFPLDSSFTFTSGDGATAYPAFVRDTSFAQPPIYNACDFTTGYTYVPTRKAPRLFPNPTTGHFTVQFADPLEADNYYSVYDTMGKLLYQRPMPAGTTTEQVDLSRFGTGSYVIKFTSPEEVCYERVVLE